MATFLLRSAIVIIVLTMIGRVMGLVRSIFISHEFGTSFEVGAFYTAFTIPNLVFLFVPGAINAVFLPSLKKYIIQGKFDEARALFQKVLTVSLLIYSLFTAVAWLYADPIIAWMTPGIPVHEQKLAANLLRWMLPSNLFIVLIGLFSSTLNVHGQFGLPNFGSIVNSLIVIFSIYLFVPLLGIHGLAIGTTLGFAGAALIMLPALIRKRYSLAPNWQWRDPELKKIGERFLPILLGSLITSLNEVIEKFLTSDFGSDKIAALSYAKQIYQVPLAVFVGAFAMPIFPLLVELIKKHAWQEAKSALEKTLTYMLLLLLPTTAGLWVLGEKIVALLFQRGQFDAYSTHITTLGLIFFALGLYPLAVRDILTRAFYALENTVIPVVVGVIQIAAYVLSSLMFARYLGFSGVALGWTVGAMVNVLLLGMLLWKKIGRFVGRVYLLSSIKASVATAGMVAALKGMLIVTDDWPLFLEVPAAILLGAMVYGGLLLMLKEELTVDVWIRLLKRLPKGLRL
ncbi:murein biosynthesis integral membrane protein MurJ [Calditerricola satsumensis]|nr:murein biosynthesis integral membrane protein MurJ [Calditerricola satsumensis]